MNIPVEELKKSPSGRAYLEKKRNERPNDYLQPNDPKFKKVYGKKISDQNTRTQQQERASQIQREEYAERSAYDKKKLENPGTYRFSK